MSISDPSDEALTQKLVPVDRAIAELRRGAMVFVKDGNTCVLMMASEGYGAEQSAKLQQLIEGPVMVAITGRRAQALGLSDSPNDAYMVHGESASQPRSGGFLCNPVSVSKERKLSNINLTVANSLEKACLNLAKLSRLLPSAVLGYGAALTDDFLVVDASDVDMYAMQAARSLRIVSQANVPLEDAENAKLIAFRPRDGGLEHFAIVVGEPDTSQPVLVRLHSECFTGDMLGSMRCDCGSQLRGAIAAISAQGSGVLLYLAQEGRGIGLVNKIRAYELQNAGFDTVEANLQLGFDEDERIYLPAAQMLSLLHIHQIRLMTNNPAKIQALRDHGIDVTERVSLMFASNEHNKDYLQTKAEKTGHLF